MLLKLTISWRWLNARDFTSSSAVMFSRICRISAAHFDKRVGGGGGDDDEDDDDGGESSVRILVILLNYHDIFLYLFVRRIIHPIIQY